MHQKEAEMQTSKDAWRSAAQRVVQLLVRRDAWVGVRARNVRSDIHMQLIQRIEV
jgi:hypothetical protein